jgi:hypothetical protein
MTGGGPDASRADQSVGRDPGPGSAPEPDRPLVERFGLGLVAIAIGVLFAGLGLAAWLGSEVFLAVMAWIGSVMTIWAAASSLRRG